MQSQKRRERKSLADLISLKGIKLLDTSALHPRETNILKQLYECKIPEQLPLEAIRRDTEKLTECIRCFSGEKVFSINEVALEEERLLKSVNESVRYFSNQKYHGNFNSKKRFASRRYAKIIRLKQLASDDDLADENLEGLKLFAKKLSILIERLKEKDITKTFSEEDLKAYQEYVACFFCLCEKHNIKEETPRDGEICLKHRDPCYFQTNEKLVAAAFTTAMSKPTILISNNERHVEEMLHRYYHDAELIQEFLPPRPREKIRLYADYENLGFKLEFLLLNNKPLLQSALAT